MFLPPDAEESSFITEIFKIQHFRILIQKKQQYIESLAADPFIIAKAKISGACVVTQEKNTDHAAKISNVCKHFGISCIPLALISKVLWNKRGGHFRNNRHILRLVFPYFSNTILHTALPQQESRSSAIISNLNRVKEPIIA